MPISINAAVTRYGNGVTNTVANKLFTDYPDVDPTRLHVFFDDFDVYNTAKWTVTETQAGATQALTDGDGGLLLLTNTAADNDVNMIGQVSTPIIIDTTKKHWFKTRFKVSEATEVDWLVGLVATFSFATTDYIMFYKSDGSTVIHFDASEGTNFLTEATTQTFAANTFINLAWYFDGAGKYFVFKDDVLYQVIASTVVPDTAVRVAFGITNGDANARNATLDYIFFAQER